MIKNYQKAKATILTPTVGSQHLEQCHQSVLSQTYSDLEHLLIVDGKGFYTKTKKVIKNYAPNICVLPNNTGSNGFYGHRIYSAFPHLINSDYILFLDEDNWIDSSHVESLISLIENQKLDWAFSLRKICDNNGDYITNDNYESLGPWSEVELIDTSAYCFRNSFIRKYSFIWDYGWGADRRFFSYIKNVVKKSRYACNAKYSLNYRLGGNENSVSKNFFDQANKLSALKYKGNYPWNSILIID